MFCYSTILGHYKVEIYSEEIGDYMPTPIGHGMFVEVSDPKGLVVMSRVRWYTSLECAVKTGLLFCPFYIFIHFHISSAYKVHVYTSSRLCNFYHFNIFPSFQPLVVTRFENIWILELRLYHSVQILLTNEKAHLFSVSMPDILSPKITWHDGGRSFICGLAWLGLKCFLVEVCMLRFEFILRTCNFCIDCHVYYHCYYIHKTTFYIYGIYFVSVES